MSKTALAVAVFSLLVAATAAAQTRDPCRNFPCPCGQHCTAPADAPFCVSDAGSCPVTTSYLRGQMDAFAPPDDPTTPSAALQTFLGSTRSQYDTKGCNRHFGESFLIPECLRCEFCGGKVEIHLKPCGGDNPSNDNYTIGIAPFGAANTIASGRIWPSGTPAETTLVVDLPASKLNSLFCKRGAVRTLDVYVEDDTIVDWVRVTVYSH